MMSLWKKLWVKLLGRVLIENKPYAKMKDLRTDDRHILLDMEHYEARADGVTVEGYIKGKKELILIEKKEGDKVDLFRIVNPNFGR